MKRHAGNGKAGALLAGATLALAVAAVPAHARDHDDRWSPAVPETAINTPAGEGCPIETPDGLTLLLASNRTGTLGGNDVWAAERPAIGAPWGTPVNLGAPINTTAADFCPTPVLGRYLMFVSERGGPGTCGGGDMYLTRQGFDGTWSPPEHLACAPDGPNTAGSERSPSLVETPHGTYLFYSTNVGGNDDIYFAKLGRDGRFGAGRPVPDLNTPYNDLMPNVRARGDGLYEIVFSSDRPTWGRHAAPGFGGQDVYTAFTWFPHWRWTEPTNLGPNVNTKGSETRATLSGDGRRLHFGRDGDIYVSER